MRTLRKLLLNLGPRALVVLGPWQYLRLLAVVILSLPRIASERSLLAVDRRMGRWPTSIRFLGRRFVIDCPAVDAVVKDGTYTFGLVRELFIRNCYVRNGMREALDAAEHVLDLGANRGLFAIMAAATARNVVAVDVLPSFVQAIRANALANGFRNVVIETAFIGHGGKFEQHATRTVTMAELMDRHQVQQFDLVKMDIEGSEFDLFESDSWLERVGAVCMEVHPEFGDARRILEVLRKHGFQATCADHTFRSSDNPSRAEFIWARKLPALR